MFKRYYFFSLLLLLSCKAYHTSKIEWNAYHFEDKKQHIAADTAIANIISPYKNAIDSQMNVVVGVNAKSLTSGKPEGSLGDFFADAIREVTEKAYRKNIDVAFFNSGGLRLPEIPAGNIKVSTIYELMPFDNEIVILHIPGTMLMKVLEYSAKRGGDPISGVRYTIQNSKPIDILVNNEPLDSAKLYAFATNDYLASGGDNMNFLKDIKQEKLNMKLRDMLFDYFKANNTHPLNIVADGRVQIQK